MDIRILIIGLITLVLFGNQEYDSLHIARRGLLLRLRATLSLSALSLRLTQLAKIYLIP